MHQTLQMTIFATIMTAVVGLVHFYLWRRLVKDTQIRAPWKKILTILTILLAVSLPTTMILSHTVSPASARNLLAVPFIWMGTMALLFFGTAAVDMVKLAVEIGRKAARKPVREDRRLFLSRLAAGSVVLSAGSLAGAAVIRGKSEPRTKQVQVHLPLLSKSMNGFKILQLTDLHIGSTLDMQWLENVVRLANQCGPDLVVITGDLVDGNVDSLAVELTPLASLQAPHGIFFVTGNHEYYSGAAEWIPVIESLGITVLRNEHRIIGDGNAAFALLGVDDFNAKRILPDHGPDLEKALRGVPEGMETILLAHQPREIFKAAQNNIGLQLSGHTHGGQLWPITHLVGLQQPYNKGLFTHPDSRTQIYVSQGTGFWGPPMRLGTENEITEIVLMRA